MAAAIGSLEPDVVILTEYVPGSSREAFLIELANQGLAHHECTEFVKGQNSVLIASKTTLKLGKIRAPAIAPAFPSNVLHVEIPTHEFEVLGVRIPDFSREPAIRRACWDWIQETADPMLKRPIVILGDFNTSPTYPMARCGNRINELVSSGWQLASPSNGMSYWTPKGQGVQIDHAFLSPRLTTISSRYVVMQRLK